MPKEEAQSAALRAKKIMIRAKSEACFASRIMRDNKEKEKINKIYESQDVERLDLVKNEYEKNKYLLKLQYNMMGKSITKNWLNQKLTRTRDFFVKQYLIRTFYSDELIFGLI
jgi:hypothetical protein